MPGAPGASRRGFTLIEALVAMTLSAVLITLVTSVFLVQNELYQGVVNRSGVQESARSVAELIASEVRPASRGAVTLAESRRLTVRTPQAVGPVCDVSGSAAYVYLPLDGQGIITNEVTGYGIMESDGTWSFYPDDWASFYSSSGGSGTLGACAAQGADTTGAEYSDFFRFDGPGSDPTPPPSQGSLLMVYREIEYEIKASGLDPDALGLFRGLSGGTAVEFATGLGADARFEYLLEGETSYRTSVTGSDLEDIVKLRIVSIATETNVPPGDPQAYSYEITVDVPLRNAR